MGKTEKELADAISRKLKLSVRTGREYLRLLLTMVRDPKGELHEAAHAEWSVRVLWN